MSNELQRSRESSLPASDERFSHPGLVYRREDPIQRPSAPGSRLGRDAETTETGELETPDGKFTEGLTIFAPKDGTFH